MSTDRLWELAGPRVFARGVADALRERCNVLIPTLDARAPSRLGAGLKTFLEGGQQYVYISETNASASLDALRAGWGTGEGMTIPEYCKSLGSIALILVLHPAADFAAWADFMVRWQNVTRQIPTEERPCVVAIGHCPTAHRCRLRTEVALRIFEWDSVVTLADIESLALAEMHRDTARGTVRKVLARIVAEVAQSDASLATYLAKRPPAEIAWPQEAVKRWLSEQYRQELSVPDEIWTEGAVHSHPARITQSAVGQKAIRDWVWRAQASVLMPWSDVHRQRNLHCVSSRLILRNAFGEAVRSVEELELGEIYYQLTCTGPRDDAQRFFIRLRNLRNRIAHRDPLDMNELTTEIAFIEGFSPI